VNRHQEAVSSWAGLTESATSAFARLWRGFMTARVVVAVVLLALLAAIYGFGPGATHWAVVLCAAYLASTVAVRLLSQPKEPGRTFDVQWIFILVVDIGTYAALHLLQTSNFNFAPLLALPVLLASVLGSLLLALGTAAAVTLLLLADAWWVMLETSGDITPRFFQSGLSGIGYFVVAFLANQLASRLVRQEAAAISGQLAARIQTQVNELIIETLADGVLVIDEAGLVRATNPAAQRLLGGDDAVHATPFLLTAHAGWQPLVEQARLTFLKRTPQLADVSMGDDPQLLRQVHVRTRLTVVPDTLAGSLCVMFLEDLREMEARLRTERLAVMGRMSAAVAHEIRNPLAAIMQANALLEEDLEQPGQQQLARMVRQNGQRLAQIVEEILNVTRVSSPSGTVSPSLALDDAVRSMCADWVAQARSAGTLQPGTVQVLVGAPDIEVVFAPDHLRRILVNLLDNALRYAQAQPGGIRVFTQPQDDGCVALTVWSHGTPLPHAIRQHLFEPFSSSESRSSGLGLYICRELCQRYGATIDYCRQALDEPAAIEGNAFVVNLNPSAMLHTA
jgi:two-component system, NtrC family, sensor histidine kinase PilS